MATYTNNGSADNDHWYFENITQLNQRIPLYLTSVKKTYIDMVCPDDKLYTVETFSDFSTSDPIIEVVCGSTVWQDDNSGIGTQAKVSFKGIKGARIQVSIWSKNTTGGYCTLQLRRQKASLFGGDYSDINTIPDLKNPNAALITLYDSYCFENASSNLFLAQDDERVLPRYNSEIMFFAGHGSRNVASFVSGSIDGQQLMDMSSVKVAVWASCLSSAADSNGNSLVTSSIVAGAKSALGFNQKILDSDAKKFTNKFFEKLAEGKTVTEAANSAKSLFIVPAWMAKIKDFVIGGDGNTVITTPTGEKSTVAKVKQEQGNITYDYSLFTHFISACEYETEDLGEGFGIRYYKLLNGCRTNQYIDVCDGKITSTNYAVSNDEKPVSPIVYTSSELSFISSNIRRLNELRADPMVEIQTLVMYIFDGDQFIPVELNSITHLNSGLYSEMICVNLNTGAEVDYEKISCVEEY